MRTPQRRHMRIRMRTKRRTTEDTDHTEAKSSNRVLPGVLCFPSSLSVYSVCSVVPLRIRLMGNVA